MDPLRVSEGNRAAQRLAIDRHDDAGAGGCGLRRWLKEGTEGVLDRARVDGGAEHTTPGALMRHLGAFETEEGGKVGGAEARPVGERFKPPLPSEFGEHGEGKEDGEGIAATAALAAVGDGLEMGSQGVEAEGEGDIRRQRHGEGECGRVHTTPRVGSIGC